MAKFTVYLMTPCLTWEDVEAKNKDEAIRQCENFPIPGEADGEPHSWLVKKEDK